MSGKRYHYIDAIRVVGMFSVIFLHSSAERLRLSIGTTGWHIDNILTSLATIAVPLFFMVSGAVIFGSKSTEDYGYVLKKRMPKLFLPLLMWSAVSLALDFALGRIFAMESANGAILEKAKMFFVSPVTIHFWFMYTLIPIYLFSPLLVGAAKNRRTLKYAAALFAVISALKSLSALLPAQLAFIPNISFVTGAAFGSYIYYFLLGYLLHSLPNRVNSRALAAAAAVTWAVISAGTYWKSAGGDYSEVFKSYTGVFCLALSCAVFLLFKNHCERPSRAVRALAPLSFGVYLIHNLLIRVWYYVLPLAGLAFTLKYVAVCFAATSVLSCAVIWLLCRFKATAYLFCGADKARDMAAV